MSAHKVIAELSEAKNANGLVFGYAVTAPTNSTTGYSKGGVIINTATGKMYINEGTSAVGTWVLVGQQ